MPGSKNSRGCTQFVLKSKLGNPTIQIIYFVDKNGNYLNHWGEGEFDRPHGIRIDDNDDLFLIDDIGHIVQKRSKEGEIIFTIGERGKAAEWQGGDYFNRPTDVAIDRETSDIFVSDGYGNSRIHKFDSAGKHIKHFSPLPRSLFTPLSYCKNNISIIISLLHKISRSIIY